jgi:hypothetical protein
MSLGKMLSVMALVTAGLLCGGASGFPSRHADQSAGRTITIAEEKPADGSDASTTAEERSDRMYLGNEPLESCMKRWDPGTHMTKEEWRNSCQNITKERGPYLKDR